MKIFADKDIQCLFLFIIADFAVFFLLYQVVIQLFCRESDLIFLLFFLLMTVSILLICFLYFYRQVQIMERAVRQITAYLDGDFTGRIRCDEEGELYRLFHSVNTLAAVLNAHAKSELRSKEFLRNTISDISHQLKTPLAALNIYNGLLQNEVKEQPAVLEFALLSEQELDRMENLVQNLLKITKMDTGSIVFEKAFEHVEDMMKDVELHFAYRAKQEEKEILLSGDKDVRLYCDRDWVIEAVDNIVKNALDHTMAKDSVSIAWKGSASAVQITVKDTGSGIHPEDLHYIFKRFYRSRFSKDTRGIGLGLPLAKTIVEAHNGTIEVDSRPGVGTVFTIHFLIPTKL